MCFVWFRGWTCHLAQICKCSRMSDFEDQLQKWREKGSLRYLADKLNVTPKQVTRYWEEGHVPGRYRTPKGHRRIAYKDNTVEVVEFRVRHAKKRNIAIRYHTEAIDYCGTLIRVKGCTNVRALYQRARDAGLDERDAWNAATGIDTSASDRNLTWEYLWALKGTSLEEVHESMQLLGPLPLDYLCESHDAKDFRSKARTAWKAIVSTRKSWAGWDHVSSSPEEKARWLKPLVPLRKLLLEPDLESFMRAWGKATELQDRIWEYCSEEPDERSFDDGMFQSLNDREKTESKAMTLEIAALSLKQRGLAPSAAALAKTLGISRPALYRTFKLEAIHAALRLLRNDTWAISEARNDQRAKGKKSNLVAGEDYG